MKRHLIAAAIVAAMSTSAFAYIDPATGEEMEDFDAMYAQAGLVNKYVTGVAFQIITESFKYVLNTIWEAKWEGPIQQFSIGQNDPTLTPKMAIP